MTNRARTKGKAGKGRGAVVPFFVNDDYQRSASDYYKARGGFHKIGPFKQKQPVRCMEDHRGVRPEEGMECLIHGRMSGTYIVHPVDARRYGAWLRDYMEDDEDDQMQYARLWYGSYHDDRAYDGFDAGAEDLTETPSVLGGADADIAEESRGTRYAIEVGLLALQVRRLQVDNLEKGFEDIIGDVCGQLEVVVAFGEE